MHGHGEQQRAFATAGPAQRERGQEQRAGHADQPTIETNEGHDDVRKRLNGRVLVRKARQRVHEEAEAIVVGDGVTRAERRAENALIEGGERRDAQGETSRQNADATQRARRRLARGNCQ